MHRVIQTRNQVYQRALAGAGRPHDRDAMSTLQRKAHILEDLPGGIVMEIDMTEFDISFRMVGNDRIRRVLGLSSPLWSSDH